MRGGPFLPKFNHNPSEVTDAEPYRAGSASVCVSGQAQAAKKARGAKLYQGQNFHGVIAGLVPDRLHKPGRDHGEVPRVLPLLPQKVLKAELGIVGRQPSL
jgi:hypothetical protein